MRLFVGDEHCALPLQVQAVELLLLLGQIHEAAGAPLAALPYVLSCLLHSTVLHMDLLVCSSSLLFLPVSQRTHRMQALTNMHPT
jgi:hypothetical protein